MTRATARWLLATILLASLALNVVAIDWGLPAWRAWAFDELAPVGVHDAEREGFAYPWINNYPPFHFYVLAVLFHVVDGVMGLVPVSSAAGTYYVHYLAARLLSAVLVTATAGVVYRMARVWFTRGPSLFAATLQALLMPHIYYAKTANLEAAYVFWFTLSLWFFARMLARGHRLKDYLAFTLAAVLSIGTKDQAVGLYVLVPAVTLWTLHAHRRARGGALGLRRTLFDSRIVLSVLVAAIGLSLVHNLWGNWEGAKIHFHILTQGPVVFQAYPATLAGTLALWAQAGRHLRFALGWPWLVLASAGVIMAIAACRRHRDLLALLCFPVSLIFLFLPLVHYHYVRFFIPLGPIAALFGALVCSTLLATSRLPRALSVATLTVVLSYQAAYAASVDCLFLVDGRSQAEAWLAARQGPGDGVLGFGFSVNLPRLAEVAYFDQFDRRASMILRGVDPRFVVFNRSEAERWGAQHQLAQLANGDLNYRLVARIQGKPRINLIDLRGVESNLDKVNPEIIIFERERPWAPGVEELGARLQGQLEAAVLDELARTLATGAYPEKRAIVADRMYAIGLTGDGWTLAGEPALLIASNPSQARYRPHVELLGHARSTYPLVVFLDNGRERLRYQLTAHAAVDFDLPELPPMSSVAYRVWSETALEPADDDARPIGVHLGPGLVEELGAGFHAIDLSHDGWTGPDRPAMLLLTNLDPSRRATPILSIDSAAPAEAHPIRVVIDQDSARTETTIAAPGYSEIALAPVDPYRRAVAFVTTDKTWQPGNGDPRSLGVRVAIEWRD